MAKRMQRLASAALGIAAAALFLCAGLKTSSARHAAAVAMMPAELPVISEYALVDLNSATEDELEALPGIGQTLAARIVEWREENGGFHSAEDVLAVNGIGEATYEKIEPYITFR